MPNAVAYLRVSTDEQAASGLGLDGQAHTCRAWSAREGLPVVGPFQDDVSGAAPLDKRPGLMEALAAIGPGDTLLVAKRDRLGRDPIAVATIEAAVRRQGGRVASAAGEGTEGDDPTNVLMRRIVDAFAEYERLLIRARTRAALDAKRRRGERAGNVPYGLVVVDDGRRSKKGGLPAALVVDPAEVEVLAEVRELAGLGWSLRRIARHLDAKGVRPKGGGASWNHTSIRALIRRPT